MLRHKNAPVFALITAALAALSLGTPAFAQPVVTVTPNSTLFSYIPGTAIPAPQQLLVSSDTSAILQTYSVSYTQGVGNWLQVFPPPSAVNVQLMGATTPQITLYLDPNIVPTLPAGQYVAQILLTVNPTPATASQTTLAVFLTISSGGGGGGTNPETVTVAPTSLAFAFQPGSAVPAAQQLAVSTSDNASVIVKALTDDGGSWLVASPSASVTPGTINVSINPGSLPGGTYTGNITIQAPNNVAQVPVTLTVGTTGLAVTPSSITINEPQNYGVSAPQPLTITATSAVPLSISTSADGNWLQVDANNAVSPATINVRANDSGLAQGTYSGMVTVQSGPSNSTSVPVTLVVGPPATVSLSPASLSFVYRINDPAPATQTTKVNSLTGAVQTFAVATVTNDGANWLRATPQPASTPGGVVVGVSPAGLAVGTYTGVVNVTPSAANASPQPILVSLVVTPAPIPTVLSVTSAASYATGAVAPGELVTIFGSSIGPVNIATAPAGTAPVSLGNTGITFDGIPAPIYYVSSTQSTVQVPYNIVPGQTLMKVSYNGVSSVGTTLLSVPAFPGLFTADSSGQRQASALNADLSVNSAANPATRGTALVLYGTGEGQTVPAVVEGSRVPILIPYPQTSYQVLVTIGGQVASVQYAGETPGSLSGLMQINVTVPLLSPVGASVPVLVSINGRTTQTTATVAIK